jgi:sugar/nucleoside kinase (ribokinase family)
LKNLGLVVAPLVSLGKDWNGQEIHSFMKQHGLKTDLIQVDKHHGTGFSFVLTAAKDHEHTIFTYKGASNAQHFPRLHAVKTDWYYVAALSMPDWAIQFAEIIRQVDRTWKKPHEIKIMWNPGEKQLRDYKKMLRFFPKIEVLMVNKDEAIELVLNVFGRRVDRRKVNEPRYLLDALHQTNLKNIIITAGKQGVYGMDEAGHYHYLRSQAKKIRNTVGAGDAFGSGFLAAFHQTSDFNKGLHWGIKNSAAVLSQVGAQAGLLHGQIK